MVNGTSLHKHFVLHTDASTTGLGAVLYQKQEDGKERVIAYASHTLNKSEWNYNAYKLEFLALKWAFTDRFHEYCQGVDYLTNTFISFILVFHVTCLQFLLFWPIPCISDRNLIEI